MIKKRKAAKALAEDAAKIIRCAVVQTECYLQRAAARGANTTTEGVREEVFDASLVIARRRSELGWGAARS